MLQPSLPLENTPGTPVPMPMTSLPGVVVVEGAIGRCAPLCLSTTTTTLNPDGSVNEWGYENATPCVIPGTLTARGTFMSTTTTPGI